MSMPQSLVRVKLHKDRMKPSRPQRAGPRRLNTRLSLQPSGAVHVDSSRRRKQTATVKGIVPQTRGTGAASEAESWPRSGNTP
ncbi:hypothetical protein EYF80_062310 [Liparis tanakae]|uniref:Uncharacterized protein n=1 Tax=Liparis tanakae TaxID=230148 RepID=A0A4Z2EGE0_9TELE|nr:hypothetical protein EYF80_062310 [Liparis tanakae]